jgi:hypothetical protein
MPDSRPSLVAAILTRYEELCLEHQTAQDNIGRLQEHQRAIQTEINDCFAAARLFGFDLATESARSNPDILRVCVGRRITSRSDAHSGPAIKSLVLNAAKMAFPHPVQASTVRRDLAAQGYVIHEKTVGMTLYRWSKKDPAVIRREGRNWYFVPQPAPVNGHHHEADGLLALADAQAA